VNAVVPRLLLAIEKSYTRFTSFSRGRFACSRMIFWGVRHLGFKVPLLRLTSGIVIEYSPSVARDAVMRDLLLTGSFEPEQSALIEALLPKGGVFLDVGANIGYFTVLGGRSVGPTGRVYAFEPVEEIHRLLSTNVSLNGLENVEALALACFSSPGQMGMERASDSGKSHLSPARAHSKPVSLTTVDDFVALARIDRVDLIKIDTEGSDLEVLKGARRTVDRFRPAIIMELDHLSRFGGSQSEVLQFFRRCGYEVRELRGKHSLDLLAKPSAS
jgi:FkbM family methyltransferase